MTITVEPLNVPLFADQTNFYYNWLESIMVPIHVQSQNEVDAISWMNNTAIQNFSYNKNTSLLNIQFLSTQNWKPVWVKLMSNDSCNRSIYSDNYWMHFYDDRPPAITNTFGPISVNRGEGELFSMPSDLFTDPQNLTLALSVSNCIDKSHYFTKIELSEINEDEYFVFAQSNDTFASWIFEIYVTNSFKISNQYQTAITNTFGPISVNRGEGELFSMPSDLFTDPQNLTLALSVSNCIDKSHYFTKIELSEINEDEYFVFAQSNDTFAFWIFEIYATNSFKISNQYQTQLNIIQWASKDWVKWNGPYQSDCTKWVQGYELSGSGACLVSSSLFALSQFIIFRILGIIVWILIIIQLLFCIKLKLLSFYSLFYMQTILVMMFSVENVSDGFTVFAFTLQWTKLDFSFILFSIQKLFECEQSSNKMRRLAFYCQSTIHNYMILIILAVVIIVSVVGINKYIIHTTIIQKLKNFLVFIWNVNISSLVLIPINISPFIIANVIIDGINIRNQFVLSLISIGAWSIILFTSWFYWRNILRDDFINRVDPVNTACYFYLNLARIIVLSFMFVFTLNAFIYCIFTFTLMILQFGMTLAQFRDNRVLSDDLLKEKLIHQVVSLHMLFLMFVIWIANIYQTESIQKIWAFMVTEFYIFLLVVNMMIKFIKIKK